MAPPPDPTRRRAAFIGLGTTAAVLVAVLVWAVTSGGTHPRATTVERTPPVSASATTPGTVPTTTTTSPGFQVSATTVPPAPATTTVVDGFRITKDPAAVPVTIIYTIQPGDTLTAIAAKFDQRGWGKLFVTNWVKSVGDGGITDPNLIYAGRVITVTTINGITNMTMSPAAGSPTTSAG